MLSGLACKLGKPAVLEAVAALSLVLGVMQVLRICDRILKTQAGKYEGSSGGGASSLQLKSQVHSSCVIII